MVHLLVAYFLASAELHVVNVCLVLDDSTQCWIGPPNQIMNPDSRWERDLNRSICCLGCCLLLGCSLLVLRTPVGICVRDHHNNGFGAGIDWESNKNDSLICCCSCGESWKAMPTKLLEMPFRYLTTHLAAPM